MDPIRKGTGFRPNYVELSRNEILGTFSKNYCIRYKTLQV
jgi:hypothetical protein